MTVHFIAIGGSAMHNLAIALHNKGFKVSGSDDEIFEPSRSRLKKYNLLPDKEGWDRSNIHKNMDAVILGMHAKSDNPELIEAQRLGLKIYSYPEFLYNQSQGKTRVVIGGSHGKTTITSMILHVLHFHKVKTDYMVGAQLDGFEVMVKLTDDAPFIVLEGDEYLSSPTDKRPKFHLYKPHIALISGIAWDHINVFPSFDNYLKQFRVFIEKIENGGKLIYCYDDPVVKSLSQETVNTTAERIPYTLPEYKILNGQTQVVIEEKTWSVQIFGKHNLLNMNGALIVCKELGIEPSEFMEAIQSFKGASNRLQKLGENEHTIVYKDFAHAPSKLQATIEAVKEQYPQRKLIAFMELHTYSSLNTHFLDQYKNTMEQADEAIVFYNPQALQIKRLPDISPEVVRDAFGKKDLLVLQDARQLKEKIERMPGNRKAVYLFMSSGNFGNIDLKEVARNITRS